ncbi:hypothetical protein CC86DRAFT_397301 [Ophiobolus disseminans]|uniref:Uncharacterized protein n=1 Tax=Ophiobolus disseminans TaxID=1469910 RepID=A0A6A6ZNB4_9PLEO|nr:hypothetical protein CC86DRAFT_397301 [Ophiobolus disseminans]
MPSLSMGLGDWDVQSMAEGKLLDWEEVIPPQQHLDASTSTHMATPQDYDVMPWAIRTSVNSPAPATSSVVDCSSTSTIVTTAKQNEVLFQQLAAAHAAQRNAENILRSYAARKRKSVESGQTRFETRLQVQQTASEQRIAALEKELAMCQKREGAMKGVLMREFGKEKELSLREQALERNIKSLTRKTERIRKDTREVKERELRCEDILSQYDLLLEGNANDIDLDSEPAAKLPKPGQTNAFSYGNIKLLDLNKFNQQRHKWSEKPTLNTKDKRFALLRKHDYYAGWLDAHRALDHQKAIGLEAQAKTMDTRDPILGAKTTYLRDRSDPRNPLNAGMNAGLLFAHAALCKTHNLPEHHVRLDTRQWHLTDLKLLAREDQFGEFAFWYRVDFAADKTRRLFKLKIERGIWKTGEDAAQIALMKSVNAEKGYVIKKTDVPLKMGRERAKGRKAVPKEAGQRAAGELQDDLVD